MNKIAIMAPTFLPWLGYFDMINKSDVFVYLDNVQFNKRSWQQRNRIPVNEQYFWLTIPVKSKGKYNQLINQVEIDYSKDPFEKIVKILKHNYSRCKYYSEIIEILEKIFKKKILYLSELNILLIQEICKFLKIEGKKFIKSSNLNISSKKGQLLFDITQMLNGNVYISADGSGIFFNNQNPFKDTSIVLKYHNYDHPKYKQKSKKFIEYCSIVDLLFNEGIKSRKHFKNYEI